MAKILCLKTNPFPSSKYRESRKFNQRYISSVCLQQPSLVARKKKIIEIQITYHRIHHFIHLYIWLHLKTCGILLFWPGIKPLLPAVEAQVLTTGLSRKSRTHHFKVYMLLCDKPVTITTIYFQNIFITLLLFKWRSGQAVCRVREAWLLIQAQGFWPTCSAHVGRNDQAS